MTPVVPQTLLRDVYKRQGNAQRLTAARTVRHVDLIHLTGLERLLLFLPAVLAARPLNGGLQLGHDSCLDVYKRQALERANLTRG